MTLATTALLLFALVPAVVALVLGVRARREEERLARALEDERSEWALAAREAELRASNRQSYSAWPFDKKRR